MRYQRTVYPLPKSPPLTVESNKTAPSAHPPTVTGKKQNLFLILPLVAPARIQTRRRDDAIALALFPPLPNPHQRGQVGTQA